MAQKMSTQTKQLWRQFTRVNHDKMDSLWLICIVLLEEAFRPPLVEFDKSWLVCFFVKTLRVPHVLLHCQQGKVRWQTVETSRDHQRHCPCQKNPEKFTLQSAVLSFVLQPVLVLFVQDRCCSSGRSSAAGHSLVSQSNVPTPLPVCRSSNRWVRFPDLPGFVQSSKKLMCYVFCVQADPAVAFVVKVWGRVGVHSLSQVLSTVLVLYFIFCFDVVMIWHVYSSFAVTRQFSLSKLH